MCNHSFLQKRRKRFGSASSEIISVISQLGRGNWRKTKKRDQGLVPSFVFRFSFFQPRSGRTHSKLPEYHPLESDTIGQTLMEIRRTGPQTTVSQTYEYTNRSKVPIMGFGPRFVRSHGLITRALTEISSLRSPESFLYLTSFSPF